MIKFVFLNQNLHNLDQEAPERSVDLKTSADI